MNRQQRRAQKSNSNNPKMKFYAQSKMTESPVKFEKYNDWVSAVHAMKKIVSHNDGE